MFQVIRKLKGLKKSMNSLNWQNGNVFEKVVLLKHKLKEWQSKMDNNPHNSDLKKEGVVILQEYKEAITDEGKLLLQKTKIEWLQEGGKNSPYFHKILKSGQNKRRIASIYDENWEIFEGNDVPLQFVKHFEKFLGSNVAVRSIENINEIFKEQTE